MSEVNEKLQKDIRELQYWLRGNGERGVFGRLDDLERGFKHVNDTASRTEKTLNTFLQARETEKAEFRGFRKAIYLIASVFAVGGGGLATWIVTALNKVLTAP